MHIDVFMCAFSRYNRSQSSFEVSDRDKIVVVVLAVAIVIIILIITCPIVVIVSATVVVVLIVVIGGACGAGGPGGAGVWRSRCQRNDTRLSTGRQCFSMA